MLGPVRVQNATNPPGDAAFLKTPNDFTAKSLSTSGKRDETAWASVRTPSWSAFFLSHAGNPIQKLQVLTSMTDMLVERLQPLE